MTQRFIREKASLRHPEVILPFFFFLAFLKLSKYRLFMDFPILKDHRGLKKRFQTHLEGY